MPKLRDTTNAGILLAGLPSPCKERLCGRGEIESLPAAEIEPKPYFVVGHRTSGYATATQ